MKLASSTCDMLAYAVKRSQMVMSSKLVKLMSGCHLAGDWRAPEGVLRSQHRAVLRCMPDGRSAYADHGVLCGTMPMLACMLMVNQRALPVKDPVLPRGMLAVTNASRRSLPP